MLTLKNYCLISILLFVGVRAVSNNVLVDNGKSNAVIVLPAKPLPIEDYAAQELQYHIKFVSGCELSIVKEEDIKTLSPATVKIYVGNTAEAKKHGLNVKGLPLNGYFLKTTPSKIFMLGHDTAGKPSNAGTAAGTLYAVYCWIENQLNIRWIFPGESGIIAEADKTIKSGDYDLIKKPVFRFVNARSKALDWQWKRRVMKISTADRLKYAGGIGGHSFINWGTRYGKDHPDWFALGKDGKRKVSNSSAMCVSNSGLQQQKVNEWLKEYKSTGNTELVINCKENDAHGNCLCSKCQSWDGPDKRWPTVYYSKYKNVGERYARYALEVQKLASKYNPDIKVALYAYMNYIYAPRKTKLNKNVIIGFVPDLPFPRTKETQKLVMDEIKAWADSGATLYYRPNIFTGYAMPEIWAHQYAEEFKLMYKHHLLGIDIDGPNASWSTLGPNLYVMARLAAEPDKDVDAILEEYYHGFGSAYKEVKEYFQYWENYTIKNAEKINRLHQIKSPRKWFFYGWMYAYYAHLLFPEKVLEYSMEILKRAEKAAEDNPGDLKRVKLLKAGLEHAILCSETCALFADSKSSNSQRLRAIEKVRKFRSGLPAGAVNQGLFTRKNEGFAWKLHNIDLKSATLLPLSWKFKEDPELNGKRQKWFSTDFDDSGWKTVTTDNFLENQGYSDYVYGWYRFSCEIPEKFRKQKIFLRLGAVDESCWVWINGKYAGKFEYDSKKDPDSWQKSHEFDITGYVEPDKKNQVTILLKNSAGKGGIWKPSYLRYEEKTVGKPYFCNFSKGLSGWKLNKKYSELISFPDGTKAVKMIGRPDLKSNAYHKIAVNLPFSNIEPETRWIFSAKVKVQNLNDGVWSLAVRQVDADGKTICYTYLNFKENTNGWIDKKKKFKISLQTKRIQVFAIAREMNKDSIACFTDVFVSELAKK